MNLLVIGGSGKVAGLVLPIIAQHHTLRIFDRHPPADPAWEYHPGDVGDPDALAHAVAGMDSLIYMAMGTHNLPMGTYRSQTAEMTVASFDVNVKGVYMALEAAHNAGITHAVYTSSMSVYDGNLEARWFPDEDILPDSSHIYGFTKRLGEECSRVASRKWGLSVNALRLCLPTAEEKWLAETCLGKPTIATTANDVARAYLAALDYRGHGFNAFMISGDYENRLMNMSRAKRLLGWEPLARPVNGG
jgi:nucleoside-diphosphate-sugar epimerase